MLHIVARHGAGAYLAVELYQYGNVIKAIIAMTTYYISYFFANKIQEYLLIHVYDAMAINL